MIADEQHQTDLTLVIAAYFRRRQTTLHARQLVDHHCDASYTS